MPQTIRHFWGPVQGYVAFNYNWDAIAQDSTVIVTASEYTVTNPTSNEYRFLGEATITVGNVVPHGPPGNANSGVSFMINVDWGSPLYVCTDITVLDDKPIEIDYYPQ